MAIVGCEALTFDYEARTMTVATPNGRKTLWPDARDDRRRDRSRARAALAKLLPLQREDFAGLFRVVGSCPVTIRTIDPPLHEFLPQDDQGIAELARATGRSVARVRAWVDELREANPMLGSRGCRLGISYPEITVRTR